MKEEKKKELTGTIQDQFHSKEGDVVSQSQVFLQQHHHGLKIKQIERVNIRTVEQTSIYAIDLDLNKTKRK